jgi:hypothetical protein
MSWPSNRAASPPAGSVKEPPPAFPARAGHAGSTGTVRGAVDRVRNRVRATPAAFVLLGVMVGLAARIVEYAKVRSFRIDEAFLALNIIRVPLSRLSQPLFLNQAAPFGFLYAAHGLASVFGYSELVLRFVPFAFGLLAMLLFAKLAMDVLPPLAAALGTALFAASPGVIYYSADFKQYSLDVCVVLLLYVLGFAAERRSFKGRGALAAIALGVVAMWFSHASVFAAVAFGAAYLGERLLRRTPRDLLGLPRLVLPWAVTAACVVLLLPGQLGGLRASLDNEPGAYPTTDSHADRARAVVGWLSGFGGTIASSLGLPRTGHFDLLTKAIAVVCLLGLVSMLRRRRQTALALALPVPLVLLASAIHRYPILQRTVLFCVPIAILFLAEGAAVVVRFAARSGTAARLAATALVAAAVLVFPFVRSVDVLRIRDSDGMKPALAYVRTHWRPGDVLFLHYSSEYAFTYYSECRCAPAMHTNAALWPLARLPLEPFEFSQVARSLSGRLRLSKFQGIAWNPAYRPELRGLRRYRRVWFAMTFHDPEFTRQLRCLGTQRLATTGAAVELFLFDIGPRKRTACANRSP